MNENICVYSSTLECHIYYIYYFIVYSDLHISNRDLSSWLSSKGVSQNAFDIIDYKLCQTNGGTLGTIGVLESAYEEACWDYGGENYR